MSVLLLVARRAAAAVPTGQRSSSFSLPIRSCRQDETDAVKRARLLYQSSVEGLLNEPGEISWEYCIFWVFQEYNKYQCTDLGFFRKRGTLENCLLLSSFTAKYLHRLSQQQLVQLDYLLNVPDNDWQLYYWITGREITPPEFECEVLKLLQQHCQQCNYSHNQ